jgi:hypothetical protein
MKKLIKAIIIGYATLWVIDKLKSSLGNREINSVDDFKQLIKDSL